MTKCPVCDAALTADICPVCGYDRSRDYAHYPTFGQLHGTIPAFSPLYPPPSPPR